jgi:hypothetical protein
MQTPLLARVNCLGLIPAKHCVIFPKYVFFNFCVKKLYGLYLETEGIYCKALGDYNF